MDMSIFQEPIYHALLVTAFVATEWIVQWFKINRSSTRYFITGSFVMVIITVLFRKLIYGKVSVSLGFETRHQTLSL